MVVTVAEGLQSFMYRCDVIYKHGQHMVSGYGSTKRQAERNAAVHGLAWLDKNQEEFSWLGCLEKKKDLKM